MPKIVNRDEYKNDLAQRAAEFFSMHGYAGVGMRGIAEHLGVSKSALYHYFPTKEALFLACTETVMGRVTATGVDPGASQQAQLLALENAMREGFGQEMALVFDYLRGKKPEDIAADAAMQLSLSAYLTTVERIVGPERAADTLAGIMGKLILEYLSGGTFGPVGSE